MLVSSICETNITTMTADQIEEQDPVFPHTMRHEDFDSFDT
jgi:hypothetical protein